MTDVAHLLQMLSPLLVLQFILLVVALIAWFKTEETKGPKWVWLLIILFVSMIGPILFFILGRRTD
ncbi:PLD nuclease N-terminal domain-containing protein [Amphibacillus indicireducens]|uniref:PLD nuclease N-terminal domain-containing protein n=1 Tax=Amphibacillus indicireducens TaxID=1076330 RepID=A0ABP7VN21_9BACI